jgi:hypothetical protein
MFFESHQFFEEKRLSGGQIQFLIPGFLFIISRFVGRIIQVYQKISDIPVILFFYISLVIYKSGKPEVNQCKLVILF